MEYLSGLTPSRYSNHWNDHVITIFCLFSIDSRYLFDGQKFLHHRIFKKCRLSKVSQVVSENGECRSKFFLRARCKAYLESKWTNEVIAISLSLLQIKN